MLNAGSDPKRELRFLFAEGTSERMRMTMDMDATTHLNDADMNIKMGMVYLMKADLITLHSPKDAELQFIIEEFGMDESKTSPMIQQGMGALKELLEGMKGSMRLDNRGQIEHVGYDMSTVPMAMRQSLAQMEDSLKQMTTSLPKEPVGIGAKWRLYQVLKAQGIEIRQQLELTLVKIDGGMIHLETKLVQEADMQLAEMVGLKRQSEFI